MRTSLIGFGPPLSFSRMLCLQLAHVLVVERHVQVELAVGDDAVIGDHRNARAAGHFHPFGHRFAVVRDDHDHVHLGGDQRFDVGDLPGVVAVGREHRHLRPELFGARQERIAIFGPARLFQGVEREPDLDDLGAGGCAGPLSLGC
jgi:hypothetical protein